MKDFYSILFILLLSITGYAQDKQNMPEYKPLMKEKQKQRYEHFELSPKFMFPNPDGLVFSDSIRHLPGQLHKVPLPDNSFYAQSTMPVANPGTDFYSNMPVMIPDSSVHYFILKKHLQMNRVQQHGKN